MALFEVILRSFYYNQECINRWTYQSSGTPAAVQLSFALAAAFGVIDSGGVFPSTAPFQHLRSPVSDQVRYEELQVRDIYSTTDFYLRPFPSAVYGLVSGESNTPFVSFGFTTDRIRTDVHRATKRLAGVPEASVGAGGVIVTAALADLTSLAEAMSNVLTYDDEGTTLSFTPCVLGKEKYTSPKGKPAYRYYATEAEALEHAAIGVSWTPYTTVRSQVSRQYGRGV